VGDLTDRGEENLESLELLTRPWFYHTLGNHDLNIIMATLYQCKEFTALGKIPGIKFKHGISTNATDMYDSLPWDPGLFAYQNGGQWLLNMLQSKEDQALLLHFAQLLLASPYIQCVDKENNRFHVVHAGLHQSFLITPENATTDADVDNWATHPPDEILLLLTQRYSTWKGTEEEYKLSTTYCGHTAHSHIFRFAKHVNLDTAVNSRSGMLTLLCHQTGQAWQEIKEHKSK